jgi:2-succinyl-5-enolpyruvyl-6-hydroxy-3-cyclohexene-1-carboxylate synthase
VRWFCEIGTHEADDAGLLHFRSVACRAFWTAAGDPRPGPVHLNVPWRDPLGPEPRPDDVTATSALALDGRDGRPLTTVPPAPSPPSPALVEALGERLAAAKRGLIVCGRMAPGAEPDIAALAAAAGFPVLAEPTSQLRFGQHDRSLVIGAYEAIARARPDRLAPDLVLRFGEMPTCKPLRQWLADLADAAHLVVDSGRGWNEPTRIAGAIARAEPGPLADGLAARLAEPVAQDGWANAWLAAADAVETAIGAELDGEGAPTEPGLFRTLGGVLADGDLVCTASSMPIRDQEAFLPGGDADVRFLANRGANGIDGLISSGIGAAVATGRPAWIVTGDLGLFHDMNALAALRHADVPVRIVVVNNDGGGIFEFLPQAGQIDREEFEGVLGTPLGLEPERIAALHGIEHARLDALDELAGAATGTALVEVRTDRAANLALHERLRAVTAAAVAAAID